MTTRIAAATAVSSDAKLQVYSEKLKAALLEQANNIVNERRLSSATNVTALVESSDSASFKEPETVVAFGSHSSSHTKDDRQDGGAADVVDAGQGSSCFFTYKK